MPESRSSLHRGGPPRWRIHRGGRPPFAATPRNRERVEQGNAGHYTRAGSGRSGLQGLSIDCCASANPAPVAGGLRFSCMFNPGHSCSILDCASHDSRDNRASALLHCSHRLPLRLSPSPAWIDRGSGSRPCSVQSVTLPKLLVRDFALNVTFSAEWRGLGHCGHGNRTNPGTCSSRYSLLGLSPPAEGSYSAL
jgi:hypothetical protein